MSRKAKKRVQKQRPQSTTATEIKNIEKNLVNIPSKLAARLNKEIAQLRKKESKLKKALVKIDALINKTSKKLNTTPKAKSLNSIKKNLTNSQKVQTALNQEVNQVSQLLKVTVEHRERLLALSKHIAQFSNVWVKSAKQLSKKTSASKSKIRKTHKPKSPAPVLVELPKATDDVPASDLDLFDEQSKIAS